MASLIDERGFNQGFKLTRAQRERLRRRAMMIVQEMRLPIETGTRRTVRILEIGCGTGELACELANLTGAHVTGVDLSPGFIEQARRRDQTGRLDFYVADIEREPFDGTFYDYIIGNGILHHLYHRLELVLPLLRRRLKSDGQLICWEPNLLNPYIYLIFSFGRLRRLARLEPNEMAFTPRFIAGQLRQAGYKGVRVDIRDFLLPNTPDVLIKSAVICGAFAERIPFVRRIAQSLFIRGQA